MPDIWKITMEEYIEEETDGEVDITTNWELSVKQFSKPDSALIGHAFIGIVIGIMILILSEGYSISSTSWFPIVTGALFLTIAFPRRWHYVIHDEGVCKFYEPLLLTGQPMNYTGLKSIDSEEHDWSELYNDVKFEEVVEVENLRNGILIKTESTVICVHSFTNPYLYVISKPKGSPQKEIYIRDSETSKIVENKMVASTI